MTSQPPAPDSPASAAGADAPAGGTDVSAADLDLGSDERVATSDPDAYEDDGVTGGTLGGLGGAETTGGGAG